MSSMADATRPWRCFWAVPLPDAMRAELSRFVAELRRKPGVDADWRFTDPEGWHITLAFLGAIDPSTVEPIVERVRAAVAGRAPSTARAGGLGGFPGGNRAHVLWLGVADEDQSLAALALDVREASALDSEQPFRAHVTLARARDRRGAGLPSADAPGGRVPVEEVVLFRSHLGQGPARYEALTRLPLREPIAAGAPR
jgi:RNA 2',3'-cyclic 3'-phosphodiesterase